MKFPWSFRSVDKPEFSDQFEDSIIFENSMWNFTDQFKVSTVLENSINFFWLIWKLNISGKFNVKLFNFILQQSWKIQIWIFSNQYEALTNLEKIFGLIWSFHNPGKFYVKFSGSILSFGNPWKFKANILLINLKLQQCWNIQFWNFYDLWWFESSTNLKATFIANISKANI